MQAKLRSTALGRVKMTEVTDEESKNRRNYQRGNVINFLDGDTLITGFLWLWYNHFGKR